jgi:uncharacterized SAM-binding protein YcdF (DUF218 family)
VEERNSELRTAVKPILRCILSLGSQIDDFLVAFLFALAVWRGARRRPLGAWTVAAGLLPCVAIQIVPVGRWLLVGLEERIPASKGAGAATSRDLTGMIILGGSIQITASDTRGVPVYNLAGSRIFEALALARRHPNARVVFTGNEIEARFAAEVLREQGIEDARVTIESHSHDTTENARNTFVLVRPKPAERWALVTSAFHMPRSIGLFRAAGWSVEPYPVNYLTSGPNGSSWGHVFAATNRLTWQAALHEWAGMLHAYVTGESKTLYPGP